MIKILQKNAKTLTFLCMIIGLIFKAYWWKISEVHISLLCYISTIKMQNIINKHDTQFIAFRWQRHFEILVPLIFFHSDVIKNIKVYWKFFNIRLNFKTVAINLNIFRALIISSYSTTRPKQILMAVIKKQYNNINHNISKAKLLVLNIFRAVII